MDLPRAMTEEKWSLWVFEKWYYKSFAHWQHTNPLQKK